MIARLIQAILVRLLRCLGIDRLAERTGISSGLTSIGLQNTLSFLLARITYWLILLFFILLALGALGLSDVVLTTLNSFFAFLPRLVTATIIFLVGAFIARIAGDAISAVSLQANVPSGRVLGQAVRYSILLVTLILALEELGVQTTILTTIVLIIVAAVGFGLALAFGIGNRRLAHSIMASFHAREEFVQGQLLTVGQYTGGLVRIGATKTLLDTGSEQVSLPNIILLDKVVRLQPNDESVAAEDNQQTSPAPQEAGQ